MSDKPFTGSRRIAQDTPADSIAAPARDQSAIDRGELPARTIPQLVSALRQSVLAAAIECNTIQTYIERGETDEARLAVERLRARIDAADKKMTLAMEEARRGR